MSGFSRPNIMFPHYLEWIVKRQRVFWDRYNFPYDNPYVKPHVKDKILSSFKFTNVYRILDRESQNLISKVIYNGKKYNPRAMFWRVLLFKHFNSGKTWDFLIRRLGDIDDDVGLFSEVVRVLNEYQKYGGTIYNNAYMMTASFMKSDTIRRKYGITNTANKHEAYMKIFETGIRKTELDYQILEAHSLNEIHNLFRSVITFGDFLSYQYAIDLNYTDWFKFDENSFISIGPGTKKGIDRTFSMGVDATYEDVVNNVRKEFTNHLDYHKLTSKFKPLPGRPPTNTDLANCFCETDKYLRGMNLSTDGKEVKGKRIKNKFKRNHAPIDYKFPPKWGIIMPERKQSV